MSYKAKAKHPTAKHQRLGHDRFSTYEDFPMSWILFAGAVLASIGMAIFAIWLIGPLPDVGIWLQAAKRGLRKRLGAS